MDGYKEYDNYTRTDIYYLHKVELEPLDEETQKLPNAKSIVFILLLLKSFKIVNNNKIKIKLVSRRDSNKR